MPYSTFWTASHWGLRASRGDTLSAQSDPLTVAKLLQGVFYVFLFSLPMTGVLAAAEFVEENTLGLARVTGLLLLFVSPFYARQCYGFRPAAVTAMLVFLLIHCASALRSELIFERGPFLLVARDVQNGFLFWVCAGLLRFSEVRQRAATAFVMGVSTSAVLQLSGLGLSRTITEVSRTGAAVGERISAFGIDPNLAGATFGAGVVLALAMTLGMVPIRAGRRLLTVAAMVACAGALVQTGSRGALLATIAATFVFLARGARLRKWLVQGSLAVIFLAGLIYAVLMSDVFAERLERSVGLGDTAGRERIWMRVMDVWIAKPVFGWGPVTNGLVLGEGRYADTHNAFLWVATAHGIVGLVPFLWVFGATGWTALRHKQMAERLVALAVFVLAVTADLSVCYDKTREHWFLVAYACSVSGILVSAKARDRERRPRPLRRQYQMKAASVEMMSHRYR